MNAVNTTTSNAMSTRESLTMQARVLSNNIAVNMWELARVFTEAKEVIPHGEFENWVKENTNLSLRTTQNMMAAYRRFGGMPQIENMGQAKTFRLLPLPEGAEEDFLKTHDVENMTAREVEKAVKAVRDELDKEKAARKEAERRAKLAEEHPSIPQKLIDELKESKDTIARQKDEAERLKTTAQDAVDERLKLQREITTLKREANETNELLVEQQKELQRAQEELLNAQSAIAKGDAERMPADRLTSEVFAGAVRNFLGAVARMPQMKKAFAAMDADEWNEYDTLLTTVEKWAKDSRKALNAAEAVMVQ